MELAASKALNQFYCPPLFRPWIAYLQSSRLGSRLARGAFWSLFGSVVSRGLALLAAVLVARMLGKVTFGELGMIQSTIGMFATVSGFGMGLTATKFVAEIRGTDPLRAGRLIGLCSLVAWSAGGVMALGLFFLAPWLAGGSLAAPHLEGVLKIASVLLLLGAVSGAQIGALSGFEAFRSIARVNFLSGFLSLPLIVGGAAAFGLPGALWGLVGSQALTCLLGAWQLRREARAAGVPIEYASSWAERGVIWRFSLPAMLAGIMVGPVIWMANLFIVRQPDGYGELGLFSAANQWRQVLIFLPGVLGAVALPIMSSLKGARDHRRQRKVFFANIGVTLSVAVLTALPIALLAPWIMAGYGEAFREGSRILVVLCGAAVLMATLNVAGQFIASEGRMWTGLLLNGIWAAAMVLAAWSLRRHGAYGLAWANLIAYGVHLVTVSFYVWFRLSFLR